MAIKLIERSNDSLTRHVRREIVNHSSLSHPHIVHFQECFLTVKYVAIVMEYCEGGNLWHYVAARCAVAGQCAGGNLAGLALTL